MPDNLQDTLKSIILLHHPALTNIALLAGVAQTS